ncbi:MAG TPA: tripartite tricarboxylate transporter permease [Bacillota bacterium]|jgi:putative tricarboxylic transport membrane protein|nr:tripartite tricarboxylate transporter permease [Bacillota bacterium]HNY68722.1 tripartite tricarboxylate transporter permease [Bacillota bacterium]HOI36799.1 tripartite tricarboxylate transporter permease [Bacillota bacterium]
MNTALTGILQILSPGVLLLMLGGTVIGLVAGALPGISATMAVALLVPFTFSMPAISGLALLGAIYMSAIYGGCFSAILINTPGTPSSIGTCFDGYPMARQGRGQQAIIVATVASVLGGLFGVAALAFLAPPLANVALKFGPPEYFWVAIFGLTIIATLCSKSLIKGIMGGLLGLLISTIGIAPIGGDVRFTFHTPALQGGVELVGTLIGLFCLPEVLSMILDGSRTYETVDVKQSKGVFGTTFRQVLAQPMNLLTSSVIGTVVGIIPGAGGSIANLVAYNEAMRSSKHPEKFGTGIIDGVIATETANNATVGGGLIPLLTLGVPGTPVDAVIYAGLLIHGLRPGAELFTRFADVTYGFIFSLFVATLMMLPVGLLLGTALHKLVSKLSIRILAPSIMFLSIIGSYAIRNNIMDVWVMLICGVIGFMLKMLKVDPAPVVLGLILGPLAEAGLVQGLLMGRASGMGWRLFFTRPVSLLLLAMSVFSLVWPIISAQVRKRRAKEVGTGA